MSALNNAIVSVLATMSDGERKGLPEFTAEVAKQLPKPLLPLAKESTVSAHLAEMHLTAINNGETAPCTVVRGKFGGVFKGYYEVKPTRSDEEIVVSLASKGGDKVKAHFAAITAKCIAAYGVLGLSRDEALAVLNEVLNAPPSETSSLEEVPELTQE
jgi:hypothetical protein